ncbi:hypothetical protein F5888DRAFT_1129879 [Russula emetica]|nr:hypothetical protein F5888DRAFT_1129879 [Russula emetica]
MVCEPDLLLYLSRVKEAGLRDRPSPDLSVRERLVVLHRWELAWDYHHNDNNEENNPRIFIRTLASWTFYIEMNATVDRRVDLGGYGFLDLRSSPLRREDVRSVRPVFKQRVGLLCYAFAIKKHNLFAVLIEALVVTLQLLNFHDCKPHLLTSRPIPITDKRFCVAKMHITEDQILMS